MLVVLLALPRYTTANTGSTEYNFCVSSPSEGIYRVKITSGVDFGKEAARMMALNEVRPLMVDQITVNDFNQEVCGNSELLEVDGSQFTLEDVERILNDPVSGTISVVIGASDTIADDVKDIVREPEQIIEKPLKEVKRFIKKIF